MPGNRLSKIDIIRDAQEKAGVNKSGSVTELDEVYYQEEKAELISLGYFRFAIKKIRLSQLSRDEDGYFKLPRNYIAAYKPLLEDRRGSYAIEVCYYNHTQCCYGDSVTVYSGNNEYFEFLENVDETELFDPGFVKALKYALAILYSEKKKDYERSRWYEGRLAKTLVPYKQADELSVPPDAIF